MQYLSATAAGTEVEATETINAITGLGDPTTKNALGEDATFTTTVVPTTKNIKATAAGTAVSTDNDTFVKSYPGETSKLVTTSVTGVSGSTTASSVDVTAGSAASWSGKVENEILSLSGLLTHLLLQMPLMLLFLQLLLLQPQLPLAH